VANVDNATTVELDDLERVVQNLINGVRDPDEMDEGAKEMDEGREEIRQRLGDLELAVEMIRESRDEA
jgi:hypothetical protein